MYSAVGDESTGNPGEHFPILPAALEGEAYQWQPRDDNGMLKTRTLTIMMESDLGVEPFLGSMLPQLIPGATLNLDAR